MTVPTYHISADLTKITIEEALMLQSQKEGKDDPTVKKLTFREAVELLEKCTSVTFDNDTTVYPIRKLPLAAIRDVMEAFAVEMESMAATTPGPTTTSDSPS